MKAAGVPVIPGSEHPCTSFPEVSKAATGVPYPLALKAVGGGGGKGIRVVHDPADLESAYERASSEAETAFGNGAIYVEQFLQAPRHIEIQVMADTHGNVLHMGERECSIQRRHQKLLEEAPSPFMNADLTVAHGGRCGSRRPAPWITGAQAPLSFLLMPSPGSSSFSR